MAAKSTDSKVLKHKSVKSNGVRKSIWQFYLYSLNLGVHTIIKCARFYPTVYGFYKTV